MERGLQTVVVLVVEDDADLRTLFRTWLVAEGATVRTAGDGFGALAALKEMDTPPDVILCDLHMPGLDGCGFVEHIKNSLNLKDLPVIAVTGIATQEALIQTLDAGFSGHLVKPVTAQSLGAQIRRALGK